MAHHQISVCLQPAVSCDCASQTRWTCYNEYGSIKLSLKHQQGKEGSSHCKPVDKLESVPSYCVIYFMSPRLSVSFFLFLRLLINLPNKIYTTLFFNTILPHTPSKVLSILFSRNILCADPYGRTVEGEGLQPMAFWHCGFDSRQTVDVCLFWMLFCQVEISATGRPRAKQSYQLWCVIACDLEPSPMRRARPALCSCAKKISYVRAAFPANPPWIDQLTCTGRRVQITNYWSPLCNFFRASVTAYFLEQPIVFHTSILHTMQILFFP
jgi:hypothetical protein